ncbi:MAG TPA: phosphodiester glycosidase family protein [Gemmatimonadaceae bacterium]
MLNQKRWSRLIAVCTLVGCGSPAPIRQTTGAPYDSATTEPLASGVVHRRLVANQGPFTINVVQVDTRRRDLVIAAMHAFDSLRGRELTSNMVSRRVDAGMPVIAAVNADFFDLKTGENENNQVVDGVVLKGVSITDSPFDSLHTVHSQFGMTCDGHPVIDRFVFSGAVLTPPPARAILPLDAINFRPRADATILYTAAYGVTPADVSGGLTVEVPLRVVGQSGDTILLQGAGAPRTGGGSTIHTGEAILAGSGASAEVIRRLAGSLGASSQLRVVAGFNPHRGHLCTLVGGWPRLVVDGRSIADSVDRLEGTFPRFSATRHPRTGVGFSRDSSTLYLITVDGRSESSSGMTLAEFASLMQTLGVAQGLNLDGGGSTTLVIRGRVVNHPSDSTGERKVGNALLLMRRR